MKKPSYQGSGKPDSNSAFDSALYKIAKNKQKKGEPLLEKEKEILKKYSEHNLYAFLRREEIFHKIKQDNIDLAREEKEFKELEDCTFEPDTYNSKRNEAELVNHRDLNGFLNDQQRFLEFKSMNTQKKRQDKLQEELKEVKKKPQLDGLSKQIVNLMDDRKLQPTHERLYQKGQQKIRNKAIDEAYKTIQVSKKSMSPMKGDRLLASNHRGKPTREALYDLHTDILKQKEEAKQQQQYEDLMKANTKFRNKESDELRIEGFKKEFRKTLQDIKNRQSSSGFQDVDPKEIALDFNQVANSMHQMEFLQSKLSVEQEDQLNDLYTLFKCNKDQQILAENLQNILMVISGQRDERFEVPNDIDNKKWELAGAYDDNSGMFYLRQGEYISVQNHFKLLRLNRLHQKQTKNGFVHKRNPEQPEYKPKITEKTKILADQRRQKLAYGTDVSIVQILLHPNNVNGDIDRLERVKKEQEDKINRELTLQPKTLQKTNARILNGAQRGITGDTNKDLYLKSKVLEKKDKHSDDYWYERNADECKFRPNTAKPNIANSKVQTILEVKGVDKTIGRHQKAQQEKDFKELMTQRSGFSATRGLKKAKENATYEKQNYGGQTQLQTSARQPVHDKKKPANAQALPAQVKPTLKDKKPVYESNPKKSEKNAATPPQKSQSPKVKSQAPEEAEDKDSKDLVDQQLNEIGDRIDERDPKLYVDVNIGKNGMERIVVYEGDTAESLAESFCQKHKLDKQMKDKLKTLLDQQIASVLPKIPEYEDMDDSEGGNE